MMTKTSFRTLLLSLALFIIPAFYAMAQVMPIQTNVTITPPYSVRLTDYASATSNKMQVQLFLKDESSVPVFIKVRMLIELDNVLIMATKKDFVPLRPLQLIGNTSTTISGTDLAPSLDPLNLEFFNDGIKTEFLKSKKLPEGNYTFSVEVYDYYRNLNLSGKPTLKQSVQLFLNEVPIWTKPANNEKLTAQDPQNIFFSWSPRNGSSRNGAFTTEYEFTMVELVPQTIDPNVAIVAATPFYSTTTRSTSLIYDISAPPLVPGRKYACRLKAYDLDKLDLFQNNGYTEVLTFTYGDPCNPPADITAETESPTSERIKLNPQPNNSGVSIIYREVSDSTGYSDWYTDILTPTEMTAREHSIKYLKPSTKYEFQVNATCALVTSDYSIIQSFTSGRTVPSDTVGNACGSTVNIPVITDKTPITSLAVGDTINVGGFKAKLTEITNNGGSFAGKCIVNVSTFGIKVLSHFTNIKVNPAHQVYEGEIVADWDKSNLIDVDKLIDQGKTLLELAKEELAGFKSLIGDCKAILAQDPTIIDVLLALDKDTIVPPEAKAALTNISDGQKKIEQGQQLIQQGRIDEGEALIAQGHDKIDAGKQTLLESVGINKDKLDNPMVAFAPAPAPLQKYGFDSLDMVKAPLTSYYESYMNTSQKRVSFAWKSLATNGTDKVQVVFKSGSENIIFRTNNGADVALNADNTLDLPTGGSAIYVKAFKKLTDVSGNDSLITVGKLNLATFPEVKPKLYIVALNGNTTNVGELENRLNTIYAPANVKWDIQPKIDFTVSDLMDRDFGAQGVEANSNFTADMNLVIDSFKTNYHDYDPNAYYIFLVDRGVSDDNRSGFMPLSRRWGFIFTNLTPTPDELYRTIAHEIGHGAFRLRHTFDNGSNSITPSGSTSNLMDYNGGLALWKNQWDNIHNPAFGLYFFQDEKEGAAAGLSFCTAFLNGKTISNNIGVLSGSATNKLQAYYLNKVISQIKVKLEISPDDSKTKVYYPANANTDLIKGWYTMGTNKSFDIPLTSFPEGKYTLTFELNKQVGTRSFYIRKQKFDITKDQLLKIYPDVKTVAQIQHIQEVVNAINKYSLLYAINTPERMAHFIGQIGAESGSKLDKLVESCNYTEAGIKGDFAKRATSPDISSDNKTFRPLLNPDLFEDFNLNKDYYFLVEDATLKTEKLQTDKVYYMPNKTYETTTVNYLYADLTIKSRYIGGSENCALFNYVYCCNKSYLGNGDIASGEGAFYRGRGFIQLTGEWNYKNLLYKPWKLENPTDTRTLKTIAPLLETDIDLSIQVAMIYWNSKGINQYINSSTFDSSNDEIRQVSSLVNAGNANKNAENIKGYSDRLTNTINAYEVFNTK